MLEGSVWGGSKTFLTDDLNYGTYRFRVFDNASNTLLFSNGFATLFQEWQTMEEAKNINRIFYQAIFFPYPKKKVQLTIEHRN
jgi:hypothetical protein